MSDTNFEDTNNGSHAPTNLDPNSSKELPRTHVAINAIKWSVSKKIYHTVVPCFLAFLSLFSATVVNPAMPVLMMEFGITRTTALLSGTLYMLGLAFGPLLLAPLSESIGRRWIYLLTSSCMVTFACGAGAAKSFGTHLICRFLCGFLGTAGIAIGGGTLHDIWGMSEAGQLPRLLFVLGPFVGPALGPLAGAYILHDYDGDWRWTQWLIATIGAPIWFMVLFMKETSDHRMTHASHYTGGVAVVHRIFLTLKAAVFRSLAILTTELIAIAVTLYTGYAYAVIFSFFASASYVYSKDYGFDSRHTGLSVISVIIGYLLAVIVQIIFEKKLAARAARKGQMKFTLPEQRLYTAMVGSVFLPIALFWWAWAPHPGGHWAAVTASGIPFGLGAFIVFLSSITYLLSVYGSGASASALAANGCVRYALGGVFPLFTVPMYEKLGIHWSGSVFAFLSLGLLPIPWLLFKYGQRLRKSSRFAMTPLPNIQ